MQILNKHKTTFLPYAIYKISLPIKAPDFDKFFFLTALPTVKVGIIKLKNNLKADRWLRKPKKVKK